MNIIMEYLFGFFRFNLVWMNQVNAIQYSNISDVCSILDVA